MQIVWQDESSILSKSFICGYCGTNVSSNRGYNGRADLPGQSPSIRDVTIHICPGCHQPVYCDPFGRQSPSSRYGEPINNIQNPEIAALYNEARDCFGCGSYTAAVMCCRKLLMHIAVSKGAGENKKFSEYVDYLITNHYIHADSKEWVDLIRKVGNDANHEIKIMTNKDAELLIDFISMILKILFDYPARAKQHFQTK